MVVTAGNSLKLPKPESIEDAKKFEGALVGKWWQAREAKGKHPGWDAGYFKAKVVDVADAVETPATKTSKRKKHPGPWFCIKYVGEDDIEDIDWNTLVNCPKEVKLLEVPEAAQQVLRQLKEKAAAKASSKRAVQAGKGASATPNGVVSSHRHNNRQEHGSSVQAPAMNGNASRTPRRAAAADLLTPRRATAAEKGKWPMGQPPPTEAADPAGADDVPSGAATADWDAAALEVHGLQNGAAPSSSEAEEEEAPGSQGRQGSGSKRKAAPVAQGPPRKRVARGAGAQLQRSAPARYPASHFVAPDSVKGIGSTGQLKKVALENFMNHGHFEVQFGPNVNFISGTNGSGKSACLQAMQFCLGARARDTGRASSAGSFIKNGCNYAQASVTVWNTGEDAVEPEEWGNCITFVRRVTASGASSYKLLNEAGRKVGRGTADDVRDLLACLNINATNPVVCMTQDTARSFAAEKSEGQKYDLYMAAMHFDEVIEALHAADERINGMKEHLRAESKAIKERETQWKEVQEKLDSLKEIDEWKALENNLENHMAWLVVEHIENKLANLQEKIEVTGPQSLELANCKLAEAKAQLKEREEQRAAKQEELRSIAPRVEALRRRDAAAKARAKAAAEALRAKKRAAAGTERQLRTAQGQLESATQSAREVEAELVSSTQRAEAEYEQQLRQQEIGLEAATAGASRSRQHCLEVEAAVEAAGAAFRSVAEEERGARSRLAAAERLLRQLQQGQESPLSAFGGSNVERLVRKVREGVAARRFHRPPLGPLGSLLSLTHDRWALAVEVALGRRLNNFLVHDHHDRNLLNEMAREVGLRDLDCTITSFATPAHNLSMKPQAPAHILTLLKVLRVAEGPQQHTVLNFLVDSAGIERSALLETEAEGMEVLRGDLGARRTVASVYYPDGSRSYRRGLGTTWVPLNDRRSARLRQDTAAALAEQRTEVAAAKAALEACQACLADARSREREAKQELAAATAEKAAAARAVAASETQVEALREAGPDLGAAANASELEQEIATLSQELRCLNAQKAEMEEEVAAAAREDGDAKADLAALRQASDDLVQQNDVLAADMTSLETAVEEAQNTLQHLEVEVQKAVDDLKVAHATREEGRAKLSADHDKALEICSKEEGQAAAAAVLQVFLKRLGSAEEAEVQLRDGEVLRHEQLVVQRKISTRERQLGTTLANLQEDERKLEKWVNKHKARYERTHCNYQLLKEGRQKRKEKNREMRQTTETTVNRAFNRYICKKYHKGALRINYKQRQLEMLVEPTPPSATAASQGGGTNLKTLSGGERSFTTLCFVLALGNQISAPFHCLDEFDVFMDAVNRRLGLQLLLEMAYVKSDTQFILLTPQDLAAVQEAKLLLEKKPNIKFPDGFIRIKRMQKARDNADQM